MDAKQLAADLRKHMADLEAMINKPPSADNPVGRGYALALAHVERELARLLGENNDA